MWHTCFSKNAFSKQRTRTFWYLRAVPQYPKTVKWIQSLWLQPGCQGITKGFSSTSVDVEVAQGFTTFSLFFQYEVISEGSQVPQICREDGLGFAVRKLSVNMIELLCSAHKYIWWNWGLWPNFSSSSSTTTPPSSKRSSNPRGFFTPTKPDSSNSLKQKNYRKNRPMRWTLNGLCQGSCSIGSKCSCRCDEDPMLVGRDLTDLTFLPGVK